MSEAAAMAAMAEMVPNPDGCKGFASNAFKKEKCKHCGRPWTEHQGAISDDLLTGFMKSINKAKEDRQKAEDLAAAKAKAKKMAKQKQTQAVEDDWLNEGQVEDTARQDSDSDDDMGFKMFVPSEAAKPAAAAPFKAMKVMNLIDFGECDVAEESPPPARSPARALSPPPEAGASSSGAQQLAVTPAAKASVPQGAGAAAGPHHEELEEEIELLRQMLRDANDEKSIQVAIIQDEVVEKQARVEELQTQNAELHRKVATLEAQAGAGGVDGPPGAAFDQADIEQRMELAALQAERLKEAMAQLQSECDRLRQEAEDSKASRTQLAEAQAEIEALRSQAPAVAADSPAPTEDAQDAFQAAALQALRAELELARASEQEAQARAAAAEAAQQLAEAAEAAPLAAPATEPSQEESAPSAEMVALREELAKARAEIEEARAAERLAQSSETELRGQLQAAMKNGELARAAGQTVAKWASTTSNHNSSRSVSPATKSSLELGLLSTEAPAEQQAPRMEHKVQVPPWAVQFTTSVQLDPGDADALAQQMGRHAAQALREIRLNAQQQLEWLSQRMLQAELRPPPVSS